VLRNRQGHCETARQSVSAYTFIRVVILKRLVTGARGIAPKKLRNFLEN
jgi:hypothetical protein